MKLVELNLFVWILCCSWDHYIGDEDKKIEKNVLPKFNCFSDPATIGPRWTRCYVDPDVDPNCTPTGRGLL